MLSIAVTSYIILIRAATLTALFRGTATDVGSVRALILVTIRILGFTPSTLREGTSWKLVRGSEQRKFPYHFLVAIFEKVPVGGGRLRPLNNNVGVCISSDCHFSASAVLLTSFSGRVNTGGYISLNANYKAVPLL